MQFKIITIFIFILLLFSFSISAQYLEVALISDVGGFGDNSYNDYLKSSLNKADNKFNLSVEFKESKLMTKYLDNINYFAENNFDLIWGVGFTMEQAIKETAQMYPEINFVIFDGVVEEENVMSLTFKKEEAAFLAGVTAALESKNSAVAFLGGKNNSEIKRYQLGFETGVQAVNNDIKLLNRYIGSFNDFSQAKKITKELADQGVDIIFYAAGPASKGITEAALEKNIKLVSLDAADIELAPNNILTVIQKNTDYLVDQIIESYYNNDYVNEIKKYGLDDNAFILEKNQTEAMLSEKTIKKIEEYKQQFLTGEIEIISSD